MTAEAVLNFPPFRLDLRNEQLWRDEVLVPLRPKQFAVLAYLASNPARLVTTKELLCAVWPDTYVSEGLVRSYIRQLRQALHDEAETPRFIETIPRRGYRFLSTTTTTPPVSSEQVGVSSAPSLPHSLLLTPYSSLLVGRQHELTQLHQWFAKAAEGTRQVVFITGEPGSGKTTLVDTFVQSLASRVQDQEDEQRGARSKEQGARPNTAFPALNSMLFAPCYTRGQCIEHYGAGEAYLPVLEALGHLCRQPSGEQVVMLLNRYAPTWLVQMPALVSDTEFEVLQRKVQGATRERMLREMAEMLEALTVQQPLVFVLEDIHWSDHSTLDLLSLLAQRRGPARLFLLVTYRPADVVLSGHPLRTLKQELQVHGQCEELPLGFLTTAEVNQYVQRRFPQHLFPSELGYVLHHSTEGNPLFMINVVDEWVRRGRLVEAAGQWQLTTQVADLAAGVPESLRQMIERQLEQLTPEERRAVETASVIGGEFSTALLAAGLEEPREEIERWCEGLAGREQFVGARGIETLADGTISGRYGFLHALYQQVLYEQLPALRRVQLHRRIGEWAEGAYGLRVNEVAAELAMHFERGQDYARAVQYLTQAADNAKRRHAYQEEISLLTRALAILPLLPDSSAQLQQELALQINLGVPLLMTRGYAAPEVEQTYARARALCQQIGESPQLLPAIAGLFRFSLMRAEFQTARELGEQVLRLAESMEDNTMFLIAHSILGVPLITLGNLLTAREHLEQGITLYNPEHHRFIATLFGDDPGIACRSFVALALWFLGYPEQALQKNLEAVALAQELTLPYSEAFALSFTAWVHVRRREGDAAQARIRTLLVLAAEQGFQLWTVEGTVLQGWVLAEQGHIEEGIAQIQQGLAAYRAMGAEMGRPGHLALLAEVCGKAGRIDEGLRALTEAFVAVDKTGERSYEAELHRLRGELLLQQLLGTTGKKSKVKSQKSKVGPTNLELGSHSLSSQSSAPQAQSPDPAFAAAEACFLKAIEISRVQQAKSLELRAVMSLVRLRQQQALGQRAKGKELGAKSREQSIQSTQHATRDSLAEAHHMLSAIYSWFTEGFDTKDLQGAKALLKDFGGNDEKGK